MRLLLAFCLGLSLVVPASSAVMPTPRPAPTEAVQFKNPDPFNTQQATTPTQQTTQPPAPQVVPVPVPSKDVSWIDWIQTGFMGILTVLFGGQLGKGLFSGGKGLDPEMRARIDAALLAAVNSGIPGQAIQTGASLIPGVGPLASTLEPMLRRIVTHALDERLAANRPPGSSPIEAPEINPSLEEAIKRMVKDAFERHVTKSGA